MTELLGSGFIDSFRYFIQTKKMPILGGHILLELGKEMQVGELITL